MSGAGRLDLHLVQTGLARSRTLAQRLIRDGAVRVDGQVVRKSSYAVSGTESVTLTGDEAEVTRWVGRGALKLQHALTVWSHGECGHGECAPGELGHGDARPDDVAQPASDGTGLRVRDRRCLDVGASTGGFTQVLLEHGASHVTALDVGRDQLVAELATDSRVTDLPGTNIRDVSAQQLGTFELIVGDLSFISLTLVLPAVAPLLEPTGDAVFLVKPQFEVGRERLGHGGVVTSAAEHARVLEQVVRSATSIGWQVWGIERSPVTGTHGNAEYLLWLSPRRPGMMTVDGMTVRIRDLTREDA